jgi:two-component system, LytTR family, sensor kinase
MRTMISRATTTRASILFAVWTAYGLLSACQEHYWLSATKMPTSWASAIRFEVGYAYLWGLCSPAILWLSNRYRIERNHRTTHLLIHVGMTAVFVVLTKTVFDALFLPPTSPFRHFTWESLFRSIEYTADTGVLLYWVVLLVEHTYVFYKRYQNSVVNAAQLQTQLVRAQLQALRMQLHPHFLFNALHTITALVHEDPEQAERTIARLSELLRLFLANSTVHEVSLGEELRILDLYLDIERTRFEDRLQVHIDVAADLRCALVPSLVLQPLVENSIRHGVGRQSGLGWISVSAEKYGGTLVLRVTDNGAGVQPLAGQGMGLSITRGRLDSLYGLNQSLSLRNLPAGGAEARITMPFHCSDATSEDPTDADLQSVNR